MVSAKYHIMNITILLVILCIVYNLNKQKVKITIIKVSNSSQTVLKKAASLKVIASDVHKSYVKVPVREATIYDARDKNLFNPNISISASLSIVLKSATRLKIFAPNKIDTRNMQKSNLNVPGGQATIYIYDMQDFISRTIMQTRSWEPLQMSHTEHLLNADRDLQFIDIGCNLGVYTILAAKMKRKVVAVDANINNLQRLQGSLIDNGLNSHVTLLLNAVHQVYKTYLLRHYPTNIGGDHIYEVAEGTGGGILSITFDDILEVIPFKKALLKLDIEGSEFAALHTANKFFAAIDIPVIFMEWGVIHRDDVNGEVQTWIVQFFTQRGYVPFENAFSTKSLNTNHFNWPWDMVWKKTSKQPSKYKL